MDFKAKNATLEEEESFSRPSKTLSKTPSKRDAPADNEYGDFDPSMMVEAEMNDYSADDEEVNIPNDDTLLPPTADGKIYCTICNGGPMQRKHLSTHMKHKHSGETFECVPCAKKFSCKAYLTNHQKSSCKERFKKL